MLKILLIPEFSSYGGTYTYFKDLLDFYFSLNYRVTVLLKKEQINDEVKSILKKYDYKYFLFPEENRFYKKLRPRFILYLIHVFCKTLPFYFKVRPDITVVSTGTPVNLLSLILLPSRFLYILHTYPSSTRVNLFARALTRFKLNKRRRIITVSEYSKNEIIKFWNLQKKEEWINVTYNTIREEEKNLNTQKDEKEHANKIVKILTIGHVRWYKNPLMWIDVAEIVSKKIGQDNVEFLWLGDGELLEECIRKVQSINLNNTFFKGRINNTSEFIKDCDIYFQPSLVESFGICVLEAMSMKKPCIVSNSGGLPEVVEDNKTGFIVDAGSKEIMAEKIVKLIENNELRYSMGQSGRKRFKDYFSYEIWKESMGKIHDSLF